MKRVIALAVLLVLAACAGPQTYWDKPGLTWEQQSQDQLECGHEADKATASLAGLPSGRPLEWRKIKAGCMQIRGYREMALR